MLIKNYLTNWRFMTSVAYRGFLQDVESFARSVKGNTHTYISRNTVPSEDIKFMLDNTKYLGLIWKDAGSNDCYQIWDVPCLMTINRLRRTHPYQWGQQGFALFVSEEAVVTLSHSMGDIDTSDANGGADETKRRKTGNTNIGNLDRRSNQNIALFIAQAHPEQITYTQALAAIDALTGSS